MTSSSTGRKERVEEGFATIKVLREARVTMSITLVSLGSKRRIFVARLRFFLCSSDSTFPVPVLHIPHGILAAKLGKTLFRRALPTNQKFAE
jgi:hypothetical protein